MLANKLSDDSSYLIPSKPFAVAICITVSSLNGKDFLLTTNLDMPCPPVIFINS